MYNTKNEKLNFLKSFEKEIEIHDLLEELLPEMGYDDVLITHEKGNAPEYGKDLICSKFDDIENKKDWYAFVVKKGAISGQTGIIREIEGQVAECFKYSYKSIDKKQDIYINKVKVITNYHYSAGAKDKINKGNESDKANIDYWDGEKLVRFIDKYYPNYWLKGSKSYLKYIDLFSQRNRSDSVLKSLTIEDTSIDRMFKNIIKPRLSERTYDDDGNPLFKTLNVNTVIEIPDDAIIVGEPGSGKTTLFKTLSDEVISQNSLRNNQEFYPIILTFKDLSKVDFKLDKAVINYFKEEWLCELKIDGQSIIDKNSCIIFIDALDELPQIKKKELALDELKKFRDKYPNIRVLCSSRPSDYIFNNCETIGFRYLEIQQLDTRQIELFVNNYFATDVIKSKSLLRSLKDSRILEKLPKTPLTIALITILFDEKEVEIPATITDLYENFISLLLGKQTSTDTTQLIEIGIKHRLLCHIAKYLHSNLIQKVTLDDLTRLINEYSIERGQPFNVVDVTNDLINSTGLLYKNFKDEISFKHQSFQEYFTAYEIFHHRQSERDLFIKNFNNLWWQNVAIFYAGMSKDAPILLDEIIANNKPKTLNEYVISIGGMGNLLQALYNTPIENRISGVDISLKNTFEAIELIHLSNEDETNFWKNYSNYGLIQIFGGWFRYNFSSITLIKPLMKEFRKRIDSLSFAQNENEKYQLELEAYLVTTILASEDFIKYGYLQEFIESTSFHNFDLIASVDTHLKRLKKVASIDYKTNESLKKSQKKVHRKISAIGSKVLSETVNVKLLDKN